MTYTLEHAASQNADGTILPAECRFIDKDIEHEQRRTIGSPIDKAFGVKWGVFCALRNAFDLLYRTQTGNAQHAQNQFHEVVR